MAYSVVKNPDLVYPAETMAAYPEVCDWCTDNIGQWNRHWWRDYPDIASRIEHATPDRYWFADESHAVAFTLKWS